MIKVNIKKSNSDIKEITMTGHADFDVHGKDIVCAAASSIAIVTVNAIEKFGNSNDISVKTNDDGYLKVTVLNYSNEVKVLLGNMIDSLKELEENYPKNIKIKM